jgi:hypothetical protein
MPQKPKPRPDNPEQFKRFIDMAREVEIDESPEALERALRKVIRPTPSTKPTDQAPKSGPASRRKGADKSGG